ncbi:MAG: glycosyltransferase, partial [Chloroflexota bacterium]|nr:glycosyltransferase [Chloroflexota bacterium]
MSRVLRERAARGTLDVLVPTYNRPAALAVTLAGLAAQELAEFRVVISDQSDEPVASSREVRGVIRVLGARGRIVQLLRHLPRRGMAEQRQFLLDQSTAPYGLFLDDDVLLEPDVLRRLLSV